MIAFIGVRISWLMLARNSSFIFPARISAAWLSASCRVRSRTRRSRVPLSSASRAFASESAKSASLRAVMSWIEKMTGPRPPSGPDSPSGLDSPSGTGAGWLIERNHRVSPSTVARNSNFSGSPASARENAREACGRSSGCMTCRMRCGFRSLPGSMPRIPASPSDPRIRSCEELHSRLQIRATDWARRRPSLLFSSSRCAVLSSSFEASSEPE